MLNGTTCGRCPTTAAPMNGMMGIRSGSVPSDASETRPMASPPNAAAAVAGDSQPGQRSGPG